MNTYKVTLKYHKLWDVTIEAETMEEASGIAIDLAQQEDAMTDLNEREGVVLWEVSPMEDEDDD